MQNAIVDLDEFFSPLESVVAKNNAIVSTLKTKSSQEIIQLLPQIIQDDRCHAKPHIATAIIYILQNLKLDKKDLPQLIKKIYTPEHEQHLPIFISLLNAHILNLPKDLEIFQEITQEISKDDVFKSVLDRTTRINQLQKEEIHSDRDKFLHKNLAAPTPSPLPLSADSAIEPAQKMPRI